MDLKHVAGNIVKDCEYEIQTFLTDELVDHMHRKDLKVARIWVNPKLFGI